MMPFGTYAKPRRTGAFDAAASLAVIIAGIIASRSGSDIVTPIPLRNERRAMDFFVRIIFLFLVLGLSHLKRSTVDNAQDNRGHAVIVPRGLLGDSADHGFVVSFDAPAQPVRHQFGDERTDKIVLSVGQQNLRQTSWTVEFSAAGQLTGRVDLGARIVKHAPLADP